MLGTDSRYEIRYLDAFFPDSVNKNTTESFENTFHSTHAVPFARSTPNDPHVMHP